MSKIIIAAAPERKRSGYPAPFDAPGFFCLIASNCDPIRVALVWIGALAAREDHRL